MMNSVPLAYRLILLALLPCIAAVLYIRGQSYDPALIDFKTAVPASQTPGAANAPLPTKEIEGYRALGVERHFTKENLYEHVDGHAEYFIGAGFKGLTVIEYGIQHADIQVEVYDMGKGIQAFGVLQDESGDNPQAVPIGAMGFKTSGGVNFIKGRYYVKISSFNRRTPVIKFARAFSETIAPVRAGQDSFDNLFSRFPAMGKAGKTRFIKEGYRGLDFLHNVIEREYFIGGKKIAVALMANSAEEIKTLTKSFENYFVKSDIRYEKTKNDGLQSYEIADKYEGNWFLVTSGNTLFGVYGTDDKEILTYFARGKK